MCNRSRIRVHSQELHYEVTWTPRVKKILGPHPLPNFTKYKSGAYIWGLEQERYKQSSKQIKYGEIYSSCIILGPGGLKGPGYPIV